jgi:hypothetical protein
MAAVAGGAAPTANAASASEGVAVRDARSFRQAVADELQLLKSSQV